MKVTNHTKTLGITAAVLFVCASALLGGAFYIISRAENDLVEKQTEIARLHAHKQELSSLARLVVESEQERAQLSSYVLREENVIDLLSLIEAVAEEQGVDLSISGLTVSDINGAFENVHITVEAEGSKASVLHILAMLENLPYQSSVRSVDITTSADFGGTRWKGTFSLLVTKQKEL